MNGHQHPSAVDDVPDDDKTDQHRRHDDAVHLRRLAHTETFPVKNDESPDEPLVLVSESRDEGLDTMENVEVDGVLETPNDVHCDVDWPECSAVADETDGRQGQPVPADTIGHLLAKAHDHEEEDGAATSFDREHERRTNRTKLP